MSLPVDLTIIKPVDVKVEPDKPELSVIPPLVLVLLR